jgi:hypothetical protein
MPTLSIEAWSLTSWELFASGPDASWSVTSDCSLALAGVIRSWQRRFNFREKSGSDGCLASAVQYREPHHRRARASWRDIVLAGAIMAVQADAMAVPPRFPE